jgi:hypothetical protein
MSTTNDQAALFFSTHATICIVLAGYLATAGNLPLAIIATALVAFDILGLWATNSTN